MSFVHHSSEQESTADVPFSREDRIEWLREIRRQIGARPDPLKHPDLPCPACGAALNVSQGRASKVWFIVHPGGRCENSNDLWRVKAADRAEAIAKWGAME